MSQSKTDKELGEAVRNFYNDMNKEGNWQTHLHEENLAPMHAKLFHELHDDIKNRFYGCSLTLPENVKGKRILDVGCGVGYLTFMLSNLVGPEGSVVGLDFSDDAIRVAKQHQEYHRKLWNQKTSNCTFHQADVQRMDELGFAPESFDIIVSSGLLAFVCNKQKVFNDSYTFLKVGGQFIMTDTFAAQSVPEEQKHNPKLWSLSMSGAMRWDEVETMGTIAGFTTPYLTHAAPIFIRNELYSAQLERGRYGTAGWRLWKMGKTPQSGPLTVIYNGGLPDHPQSFVWDIDMTFKKGEPVDVDGELATILSTGYLKDFFTFKPCSGKPVNRRNQNPFAHLDKLAKEGIVPHWSYTIEQDD